MLTIVDQEGAECDAKILNELISVVNLERQSSQYDGRQDAELGFHFMKSLGRLAKSTMSLNDRVSSKIRIFEGQVASNLSSNPGYPKNALEALGAPMVIMAQGYSIRHDQNAAFESLGKAVDVGFGDFEMILTDPLINRLENRGAIEELVDDLKIRYKKSVAKWSQTVVGEFKRFPFNFDLADIEGGRTTSTDFRGKVLVIDLWATWCPPCRKGIPHYIELQNKFVSDGVAVLGVSMDNPQDPVSAVGTVEQFAKEQKFNYPCAMGDESFSRQVPGKSALPTTLFLDQDGNVRYIARGYHDYSKIEAITKVLASESQPVRAGMPVGN